VKLSAAYPVPAPRERVFAALTDPDVLQRCIDGCESFERKDDGTYEARLRVGVGSVKGVFTGQARMEEVNPPASYTLKVDGRGAPGFVNGSAAMRLEEDGQATRVSCDAEVAVGGVIVAVGSRLIEAAARRMMDRFFQNLARQVAE
jgi:carbon monoxide dehydrogenase subunit G